MVKKRVETVAMLTTICFDADDTLWHNERFFRDAQARFFELLSDFIDSDELNQRLLGVERVNVTRYGFGIKGFILSMVETALDVSDQQVSGSALSEIIEMGQEMLNHPIELLPGAEEAVQHLAKHFHLLVITKGDLLHQEQKLAQSGLRELFDGVEIVSDKSAAVYGRIFAGRGVAIDQTMMIGNSLKSDINPVLDIGGWGVYIPHGLSWELEHEEPRHGHNRFHQIPSLVDLPKLVSALGNKM